MLENIGLNAGRIWEYLNKNGEVTITNIKKDLELSGDEAAFAIGWLARENKISMTKKGNSIKISLVKELANV